MIDQLLAEQRTLTAATQFSRWHDDLKHSPSEPRYRNLIPLTKPSPGEQFAFEVELDKCSGCKACVTACHNLNQLNEGETWRSVGFLHGGNSHHARQTNVTTACHHCVEPACLEGCPVLAYEKDSITGIVLHLADRCMGCQYCTLKCPYEVPQFRKDQGIVRKCDMCSSRLANNEAPACVQSCPNEAIRIVIVNQQQVLTTTTTSTELVPGAPKSAYTVPSTRYKTADLFCENTQSADISELKPQTAHWPLSWMLVITQLAVGFATSTIILGQTNKTKWLTLGLTLIGLATSLFHLGKPFRAWRALRNLRHSWLSREIAAFSLFAFLVSLNVLISFPLLRIAILLSGAAAVFTSVMIYADTRRPLWTISSTGMKFFGSVLLLGFALLAIFSPTTSGTLVLLISSLSKMLFEAGAFLPLRDTTLSLQKKSALLLIKNLRRLTIARFACGIVGGIALPLIMMASDSSLALSFVAFTTCFAGEILERHLFFRAAVTPKMPGGVAA